MININTGSRGDILYYGSSGTVQKLSLGATGKILKSNGTDLVYGDSGSIANVYYVSPSGTDELETDVSSVQSVSSGDSFFGQLRFSPVKQR